MRTKFIKFLGIAMITLVVFSTAMMAQSATPRLFYSDLESGPNTGGQNNNGAFVTLWGEGLWRKPGHFIGNSGRWRGGCLRAVVGQQDHCATGSRGRDGKYRRESWLGGQQWSSIHGAGGQHLFCFHQRAMTRMRERLPRRGGLSQKRRTR